MPCDLATICERIEARIVALDATAWAQAGYASAWHVPPTGLVSAEGQIAGHLAVEINVRSSPVFGGRSAPDEDSEHRTQVEILFGFHRRPTSIVADERIAMRAARQIWSAMHQDWSPAEFVVEGTDAWQPLYPGRRDWILVVQTYSIIHDMPMGGV